MSESKFFSPLKALKRPDDIASLYLLYIGLGFMLAYSVSPMSFGKAVGIFALVLATAGGGYLIANYTGDGRDESGWLHWMTSATFMISIVLAAFVDPTWLAFAWLLPIEFTLGWRQRVYGKQKKASISRTIWYWCLIALGIHATYWAVNGHWTLWLPAGAFAIVCGCFAAMLLAQWHDSWSNDRANRRAQREREREWKRDRSVVEVLLPLTQGLLSPNAYRELSRNHSERFPIVDDLLRVIAEGIARIMTTLEEVEADKNFAQKSADEQRRRADDAEAAFLHGRVVRTKLALFVFEILARFRSASTPVNEGTLAQWRRDIGFELVASHLLDLYPDAFQDHLADWPVSGAYVKALLRHGQMPVTGYPSLSEDWQRALSAVLLANTVGKDEDAVPSAPTPAP